MRTKKQIDAEIKKLREAAGHVPKRTMFGDNNLEAINAEIEVLKRKLTEEDVFDRSEEENEYRDESKWSVYARDIALGAARWLSEESAPPPSDGWKSFKEKAPKK